MTRINLTIYECSVDDMVTLISPQSHYRIFLIKRGQILSDFGPKNLVLDDLVIFRNVFISIFAILDNWQVQRFGFQSILKIICST